MASRIIARIRKRVRHQSYLTVHRPLENKNCKIIKFSQHSQGIITATAALTNLGVFEGDYTVSAFSQVADQAYMIAKWFEYEILAVNVVMTIENCEGLIQPIIQTIAVGTAPMFEGRGPTNDEPDVGLIFLVGDTINTKYLPINSSVPTWRSAWLSTAITRLMRPKHKYQFQWHKPAGMHGNFDSTANFLSGNKLNQAFPNQSYGTNYLRGYMIAWFDYPSFPQTTATAFTLATTGEIVMRVRGCLPTL